jgi:hypothetical protein
MARRYQLSIDFARPQSLSPALQMTDLCARAVGVRAPVAAGMRGLSFIEAILATALAVEGLVRGVVAADEDVIAEADFGGTWRRRQRQDDGSKTQGETLSSQYFAPRRKETLNRFGSR